MDEAEPGAAPELLDVIPVLPYDDIRAAHDFLVDVVGLSSGGLVEHEGTVVHGEVQAGGRRIWLHASGGPLRAPGRDGPRSGGIVLHVGDVDAHFARALAAGATILREPTDEDYGQREYGLRDPGGHDWYVATPFDQPPG